MTSRGKVIKIIEDALQALAQLRLHYGNTGILTQNDDGNEIRYVIPTCEYWESIFLPHNDLTSDFNFETFLAQHENQETNLKKLLIDDIDFVLKEIQKEEGEIYCSGEPYQKSDNENFDSITFVLAFFSDLANLAPNLDKGNDFSRIIQKLKQKIVEGRVTRDRDGETVFGGWGWKSGAKIEETYFTWSVIETISSWHEIGGVDCADIKKDVLGWAENELDRYPLKTVNEFYQTISSPKKLYDLAQLCIILTLCGTEKIAELQLLSEKIQGLYLASVSAFYSMPVNSRNYADYAKKYDCDANPMYDLSIAPLIIRTFAALLEFRNNLANSENNEEREKAEILQSGLESLIFQVLEDPLGTKEQKPRENLECVCEDLWAYNEKNNIFEIYYVERVMEALVILANAAPTDGYLNLQSRGRGIVDVPNIEKQHHSSNIPLEINVNALWDALLESSNFEEKVVPQIKSLIPGISQLEPLIVMNKKLLKMLGNYSESETNNSPTIVKNAFKEFESAMAQAELATEILTKDESTDNENN